MKKCAVAVMFGLAAALSFAEPARTDDRSWRWSPLGVGIAAPLQLPFVESDVYGLRLGGLFGYNNDVYGLDLGIAEVCAGDFRGAQVSAMSWTEGNVYGLQLAPLANVVNGRSIALQVACVNADWDDAMGLQLGVINHDANYTGVQIGGIINWNNSNSHGLEISLINANQDEFYGWAVGALVNYSDKYHGCGIGLVNVAYDVTGLQLGLVNACDRLHGVQFGLINLICESKLPIMVIANAAF